MGPKLHLFSDGVEYYSAETLEEAYVVREAYMGTKREDGELDQVDDDRVLAAWANAAGQVTDEDEPGSARLERTAAEWAALAMGFVFTTER